MTKGKSNEGIRVIDTSEQVSAVLLRSPEANEDRADDTQPLGDQLPMNLDGDYPLALRFQIIVVRDEIIFLDGGSTHAEEGGQFRFTDDAIEVGAVFDIPLGSEDGLPRFSNQYDTGRHVHREFEMPKFRLEIPARPALPGEMPDKKG